MCFGPVSSFSSSAGLAILGFAALKNVRSKKEILLAFFPLLFAIQQFTEGLIWLAVKDGPLHPFKQALTFIYIFFAYLFWPVFSPLSVYVLELQPKVKREILWLFWTGAAISAYLSYLTYRYPATVKVFQHSLRYETTDRAWPVIVFYVCATFVPFLISSYKPLKFLGVLNILFCGITYYFYAKNFDSVWCFFAALLSAGILFFLNWLRRRPVTAA